VIKFSEISASKDICCQDLLCCILGLSSTDSSVFEAVKKRSTVSEIMAITKKSQPRVQVSLKKLTLLGLIERQQISSSRGLKYVYKPIKKEQIRKKLLKELRSSYSRLKKEIERL
jgi:predicted transcriptional regulator